MSVNPKHCGQARSKVLGKDPRGTTNQIKQEVMDWAIRRGWHVGTLDDPGADDEADTLLLLAYATVKLDRTGKAHHFNHGSVL